MKIAFLIAVPLLLSCSRQPTNPRFEVADFAGEWVAKHYIEEVERTRQPHQAWSLEHWALSFSIIKTDATEYEFNATTLNEGGLSGRISHLEATTHPGEFRLVIEGQKDYVLIQIESESKRPVETVRAADSMERAVLFTRLPGTLDQYINRLVIAGKYQGVSGEEYTFDEIGEARWPGQTFHYEVSLNPIEAGCEYIEHDDPAGVGGRKRYGYRWNGSELDLFNINYRDTPQCVICCDAKPFATLHRRN
jgi:hypothetical protein